jgi:hypothetical protein
VFIESPVIGMLAARFACVVLFFVPHGKLIANRDHTSRVMLGALYTRDQILS